MTAKEPVGPFADEDLLLLSGLQHAMFCERQWGLIHLEGLWLENRFTAEGRHLHEKTDSDEVECRPGVRIARGLRLRSLRYGIIGRGDVVEFHEVVDPGSKGLGVALPRVKGHWQPFPIEYKRGKPKPDRCDEVQLCAQALCLEEMLGGRVPVGALYYGLPHRRYDVALDGDLRDETVSLIFRLHELHGKGMSLPPRFDRRCQRCSLLDLCLPRPLSMGSSARSWLDQNLSLLGE